MVIKRLINRRLSGSRTVQDGSYQFNIDFILSFFRDHRNLMLVCFAGIGKEMDKW
jgi:hypothetical protein